MKKITLLVVLLFTVLYNNAQNRSIRLNGAVVDAVQKKPLSQASVYVEKVDSNKLNSITGFAITGVSGLYNLTIKMQDAGTYKITASHIGFTQEVYVLTVNNTDTAFRYNFFLTASNKVLEDVFITNKAEAATIKRDTIEFKADSFRTVQTPKVEDLIRNIEGFQVDGSGRITFRGKEVSTLLLDGDDLTQDQYQLLTRNLNAVMVDKLQVIDNYNKNRIKGGVLESGQVAVNLKIKKAFQNKTSGNASIGAGYIDKRYQIDVSLVSLRRNFKSVLLFNSNNIAKDPTGLLNYEQLGMEAGAQQNQRFSSALIGGAGIISSSTVSPPSIEPEYVLNNKNYFVAPLIHFKVSNCIRIATRFSAFKDLLPFLGGSTDSFIVNNTSNKWQLVNEQQSFRKREYFSGNVNLLHDNMKRFAGTLNIQWGILKQKDSFLNKTSGFFIDTLSESATTKRTGIAGSYNGALRTGKNSIVDFNGNISVIPELNNFENETNRLYPFYGLDSSYRFFVQETAVRLTQSNVNVAFIRKEKKYTLKISYTNELSALAFGAYHLRASMANAGGFANLLNQRSKQAFILSNALSFQSIYKISDKNSLYGILTTGLGTGIDKRTTFQKNSFFLWKANAGFSHKLRAFSGINFSFSAVKEMPSVLQFHPATILSANTSFKTSATRILPVEYYLAGFTFSKFRYISKFSLQAGLNLRYDKIAYGFSSFIFPAYNVNTEVQVHNNKQINFDFDISSFVFPINSIVKLGTYANYSIAQQILDGKPIVNNSIFGQVMFTWVPALKAPISAELKLTKTYFGNVQRNNGEPIKTNNTTTNLLINLRSKFSGKYYIGIKYHYFWLSPLQQFQLCSIFQHLSIVEKLSVDLILHNILNGSKYSVRSNTPNMVSENYFIGVGRYFLFKINFSF